MNTERTPRYIARPDADGLRWSVVDKEAGSYARCNGRWLTGLAEHLARQASKALNLMGGGGLAAGH